MMKVFVVEDERNVLAGMIEMLKELPVEVVGSAGNVQTAYDAILESHPELVLMDIKLGHQNSFQLLDLFDEISFKIVFVTAHQEFALNAFKFSAVDYLLKPIKFSALQEAIEKVQNTLSSHDRVSVDTLKANLAAEDQDQQLILKTQDKIYIFKINEIIRCESDQSYTIFYTEKEKVIISKTMGYYEDLLSPFGFIRIHKSHMINLTHVHQVLKSDGGSVLMSDGAEVGISQRKKEQFMRSLDQLGLH